MKKIVFRSIALTLVLVFKNMQAEENSEKVFTEIYNYGGWGKNEQGKGFSGQGSTVSNAFPYMRFLEDFLKSNPIGSVFDLGCGDWTFSKHFDWGKIQYYGMDVVKEVIIENIRSFSTPTVAFIYGDALNDELPKADLLLCKDVLMHLTNDDIHFLLKKFKKYKHCLFTNNVDSDTLSAQNQDIQRGHFRTLDLTAPPFNIDGIKVFTYSTDHSIKQILYVRNYE